MVAEEVAQLGGGELGKSRHQECLQDSFSHSRGSFAFGNAMERENIP